MLNPNLYPDAQYCELIYGLRLEPTGMGWGAFSEDLVNTGRWYYKEVIYGSLPLESS